MKDVAISAERLSLMIEFHHRGSLTSLDRSMNFYRGSASKVDSLKSSLEVNKERRNSNPSITLKNSTPNLRRHGSLGRDKVYKDSSSSITPLPTRKNVDTMSTLEEVQVKKDSSAILEEEESSKDNISTVGIP